MKVIPPLTITTALLTSSTAAEPGPGETAWNAATNYSVGTRVIRTGTHRVYENLIAGVDAGVPESTPTRWLDVGPTNRYAMFDLERNSSTVVASPLTVVITPGKRINSIALLGLVADDVTITVTVGATTVYSYTEDLTTRVTSGWYDYYFGEFGTLPTLIKFDIPPFTSCVVTVTLTKASGNVQCSSMVIGTAVDLGKTKLNPRSDSLNFSRIERDSFGSATLVPRRSIPKTSQTTWIDKGRVNKLLEVREALNAVPAVWSGLDDLTGDGYFNALLILGVYKAFSIDLSHQANAVVTLELEEI